MKVFKNPPPRLQRHTLYASVAVSRKFKSLEKLFDTKLLTDPRNYLFFGLMFGFILQLGTLPAGFAHHGEHHHEPPPVPTPPPPTPQFNSSNINSVQIPNVLPSTIIPTDVSGIGGDLGRTQGLKQRVEGPPSLPASVIDSITGLIKSDPRYCFSGEWIHLVSDHNVDSEKNEEYLREENSTLRKGRVTHLASKKSSHHPAFMPTVEARYHKAGNDEIRLDAGAILVKGQGRKIIISTEVNGQKVQTHVHGGAIAMVSMLDHRPIVLNLTDCRCGSCVIHLPHSSGKTRFTVELGEIAEIYPPSKTKPKSTIVASKFVTRESLPNDLTVQLCHCDYLKSIKRYNLAAYLPASELNRVLKAAAARAFVKTGRHK